MAEMLLCNAFEIGSKNGSEINTAVLQQGLQQSINGFNDYYRSLKSFLNDWGEDYWNKLCNYSIGPLLEPEDYTLVNDFRSYGLMSDSIHEWGGGMSEHFQQYMEYERRITPIWPQIGDIERFLRKLIQPQLESQFGADWFLESSTQKDPFYASIFNELRILMNREQKRHGLGNSSDLLEYAYPGTLKDIILHDWKHYQKVFCDKKNDFISNIDAICLIRNPLAHHRSPKLISPELVEKARQACDTLQNHISNWIADPEKT